MYPVGWDSPVWSLHRIKGEGGAGRGGLIDHMIWFAALRNHCIAAILRELNLKKLNLSVN